MAMEWRALGSREGGRKGGRRGSHIPPASMPPTSTSDTLRSTVLRLSLTVSVALLRATNVVEKARGAKRAAAEVRPAVMAVRMRKDIVGVEGLNGLMDGDGSSICEVVWSVDGFGDWKRKRAEEERKCLLGRDMRLCMWAKAARLAK